MHAVTRCVALAVVELCALVIPLAAQERAVIEPGARVRVSAASDLLPAGRVVGTVLAVTPEELGIRLSGDEAREIQLPHRAITQLDVSYGQHTKLVTGLVVGFLGGAAAGAAIGGEVNQDDEFFAGFWAAVLGAGIGALGGSLIGAVVGQGIHVDRWEAVPLPLTVPSSSATGRAGFTLAFRLRW